MESIIKKLLLHLHVLFLFYSFIYRLAWKSTKLNSHSYINWL